MVRVKQSFYKLIDFIFVGELSKILDSLHDTRFPHDQRGLYLSKIEAIQYIYKKARVLQRVYLQVLQSRSTIQQS